MRLIFAGTPVFAERALETLLDAGHEIALVLTRADRPAGRGQHLQPSPVKRLALARGLPVFQPRTLRDPAAQSLIREAAADAMVVAAYGLILPPAVLGAPRLGCINIHASLLPRWRGAAPIQRAIEAGDRETGITIMQMDEGLDTGAMLLARAIPIAADETGGGLHDRLAALGAAMIVETLEALARDALRPVAQPAEGVTYAARIEKAEIEIDWRRPAPRLADRVRAFDPFPGTLAKLADARGPLKIWRATAVGYRGDAQPGTVIGVGEGELVVACGEGELVVACGEGALSLHELQKPGGRRMPVRDFLRGFPIAVGARFALPQA